MNVGRNSNLKSDSIAQKMSKNGDADQPLGVEVALDSAIATIQSLNKKRKAQANLGDSVFIYHDHSEETKDLAVNM